MKIQRIQITIEPVPSAECRTFIIEVQADGRTFTTISRYDDDHFNDVFGHIMWDAERSIRTMIEAGETSP